MDAPEINVEVVVPEPKPDTEESGAAPAVVVVEAPAAAGGEGAITASALEMLAAQIAELRTENDSLKSRVDFLSEWQSRHADRIAALEVEEEIEEGEIVAESIPVAKVAIVDEPPPVERKRGRFV